MAIRPLAKPAGTWCTHVARGRGCGIYDQRPTPCRAFACLWLQRPALTEALRPDRSKVVLTFEPGGGRLVAWCDPGQPTAWRQEPIYATLKGWAAKGWSSGVQVLAAVDQHYWAITPTRAQPDIDVGVLTAQTPFEVDLMSDGRLVVQAAGCQG